MAKVKRQKSRFEDSSQNKTIKTGFNKEVSNKSFICFGLLIAFLLPLVPIIWPKVTEMSKSIMQWEDSHMHLTLGKSQEASFFKQYSVKYELLLREREENMKKYNYNYDVSGIDRREKLSLEEFYEVYDGKWPVILTDVVPKWQASNWTAEFFNENYGQERIAMKAVDLSLDQALSEIFLTNLKQDSYSLDDSDLIFDLDLVGELKPTLQQSLEKAVSLALPLELFYQNLDRAYPDKWTYIEDELFIPMRPELFSDIGECQYMDEDFYQLFPHDIRPWNAMLLWGTKYSRSSLHIDPYNWTGTNAVLTGRKKWRLYPPGQDHLLYVKRNQTSGFPLNCYKYNSQVDSYEVDQQRFPNFSKSRYIEFDQVPGDLLFIPTGWFHQAYNMEKTIAVSSQIMNRNNYRIVLEEILKVTSNVKRSSLPRNMDQKSPEEQVNTVMRLLPQKILDRGRMVTQDIINQIEHGYEKAKDMLPEPLE